MSDSITQIVPLFSGDPELEGDPQNSADVAARIAGIRAIEKRIEGELQKAQDAQEFYAKRIEGMNAQIEFLKGKIEYFLGRHDLKTCATHLGTATLVERHPKKWPEDNLIVEWVSSQQNITPETKAALLKTEVKPNKTAISAYLKDNNAALPGLTTETVTTLQIR